jgi:RNA polymerase primary sigma factor
MSVEDRAGLDDDLLRLDALLERIEHEHPELAATRLDREVAELLGRPTDTARRSRTGPLVGGGRRRRRKIFRWYGRLVARWPVLDAEQTAVAAKMVEVGLLAVERLETLDEDHPDLRDLHELARSGTSAFSLLVASNLRLVFHWSKGVASSVDDDWAQDAFQAGCLGLMRGIQGWDYAKGYTLSTFVSWHIRQAIQRWRANDVLLIRIPVHVWDSLDGGSGALSPVLRAAAERSLSLRSLDVMPHDDPRLTYELRLDGRLERAELRERMEMLLASLSEREAMVLRHRHGFDDDQPKTLDQIGTVLGVTRERVRQIEGKAIEKLRHPSRSMRVRSYFA